jgi:type I restriction enzyme S subunit
MIGQKLGKTGHEPNPDLPDGFQMTELGPLPQDWRVVRLGEVAGMRQGQVLPTSSFTQYGYPVYGANGRIGWFSAYTHAEEEVLVTCRGATCGTINISPPKSFITNNAMIVTPIRNE